MENVVGIWLENTGGFVTFPGNYLKHCYEENKAKLTEIEPLADQSESITVLYLFLEVHVGLLKFTRSFEQSGDLYLHHQADLVVHTLRQQDLVI